MNTKACEWSSRDEQLFKELEERRTRVLTERYNEFSKFVHTTILEDMSAIGATDLISRLVNNADDVRDALKPFDSGVRVAKT